jgi:hypothetical protein
MSKNTSGHIVTFKAILPASRHSYFCNVHFAVSRAPQPPTQGIVDPMTRDGGIGGNPRNVGELQWSGQWNDGTVGCPVFGYGWR